MKSILPIFASLLWAATGLNAQPQTPVPLGNATPGRAAPAAPASANSDGDVLLRRVLAAVSAQTSISAKLRHRVDLLGGPLRGTGIYLQQGRGAEPMLRLELKFKMAGQASSLQHVCDGTTLWIYELVDGNASLSRVDVARLRRARTKSQPAVARPSLALGGLPGLLAGIEGSFHFGSVTESRLDDELRVWTIEGQWKPARLAALLPDQKSALDAGQPVDLTRLAANLPDRVVMHVGCDDLFPYRFEYWRAAPDDKDAKAKARGKLLLVMELYEVQFGAPVDPRSFAFQPGNLQPVDRTPAFLNKLGLEDALPEGAHGKLPPRR
jgi:hypothetical protein